MIIVAVSVTQNSRPCTFYHTLRLNAEFLSQNDKLCTCVCVFFIVFAFINRIEAPLPLPFLTLASDTHLQPFLQVNVRPLFGIFSKLEIGKKFQYPNLYYQPPQNKVNGNNSLGYLPYPSESPKSDVKKKKKKSAPYLLTVALWLFEVQEDELEPFSNTWKYFSESSLRLVEKYVQGCNRFYGCTKTRM